VKKKKIFIFSSPRQQTALEILKKTEDSFGVFTMVRELDEMLGAGVPFGKITEFCGAPGLGKTQLGIQLAVNVHLPECIDGPYGSCIYIDTEGSFMAPRVAEIAESFIKTIRVPYEGLKATLDDKTRDKFEKVTVESIMESIYYFRVHNYIEQLALVNVLADRIKNELTDVKLIVVDSVAFHFRRHFDDYAMRTRLLSVMSQTFIELAKEFNLAVVLMNQVTTKFGKDGKAELVPALGETYAHSSTNRIMLYEKGGTRYAKLLKSPNQKKMEVPYQIKAGGMDSVYFEEDDQRMDQSE
jgi:RAD51-like protein 2